ncbi:MAG TPA: carboxylesterase [Thiomicrorhabdus sp.]|nr:carboxylesterase [Thiomicrorhabdus sp.]
MQEEGRLENPIIIEPQGPANAAVIWLHGLGAGGGDFAGLVPQLNLPEDHGIRFVFPHAPVQSVTINGGMKMRSWYDIRSVDFANNVDELGIQASCEQVYGLIQAQLDQGVPANRVLLAGFSQGGLIALHAGLHFKRRLAGIMALSTYCPMIRPFTQSTDIPIFMAHGQLDTVIPFSVSQASCAALEQAGYTVQWHDYPMEHQVCAQEIKDIVNWLSSILLR